MHFCVWLFHVFTCHLYFDSPYRLAKMYCKTRKDIIQQYKHTLKCLIQCMNLSLDCYQDDVVTGSTHTEGNFICNLPCKMSSAKYLYLNCETSVDGESLTPVTGLCKQMETSCDMLNYQEWWEDRVFCKSSQRAFEKLSQVWVQVKIQVMLFITSPVHVVLTLN